jgi:hypothetical protein
VREETRIIPFPEYREGTHWRNPATCIQCGIRSVVNDPEDCRYCGEWHPDRCCRWEHQQSGFEPDPFDA